MKFSNPDAEIKAIILNNPNKDRINAGRKYSKELRMHMYGEDLEGHFEMIKGFEALSLKELRVKYAKSNKDLFSRLARPIDKVFSSRGGSRNYYLNETSESKASALTMSVRDGYPAKKWVENYWKPHMLDDPFGVIFIEIGDGSYYSLGMAYPTYKSINYIYDYLPKGSSLEYIVFELTKSEAASIRLRLPGIGEGATIYRVVDDVNDYLVKKEGEDIAILRSETIPNYFGKVPAMINSDFISGKDGMPISLFDDAIELANHFLLKGSIKITHDFMHGFPKYWEYSDSCDVCHGTRYVDSEECKACKGTGNKLMTKVSDAKMLTYPTKEDVIVAPNVAGYVTPDKNYWDMATQELSGLEAAMEYTIWGASSSKSAQGPSNVSMNDGQKTATQIIDDMQPKIDRLYPISEMAERRDKFICDHIIMQNMRLANYQGCSINYGRRYIIESPDALWDKYSTSRKDGASPSVLDDLLTEYFETKYSGDEIMLHIQLKLMVVEPFIHNTVAEVKNLSVPWQDYLNKLYFHEWKSTIRKSDLLIKSADDLKIMLAEYVAAKNIQEPKPVNPIMN